jgi:cyclopropane fatty-acyl-phospholipid synthase-like methyltransferase
MNMTGGGPEWFDASSADHIVRLQRHVGIAADFTVLEIGCGIGRDAIPLTEILSAASGGRYIGTDIVAGSIAWCRANIQARHPHFVFHHLNIRHDLYNPAGTVEPLRAALPAADSSVDRIIAQSVFTHMLQPEVEHYLAEFRRVLKPGSKAFTTTFIYDDAILQKASTVNLTPFNLRFAHPMGNGCRVNDPQRPTVAVAYTAELLDRGWSGFFEQTEDGQDALVLTSA